MKQAIAVVMALGLVGAVGCDSGETKKAEPKADPAKTDPTKDVATPPDPKPEPAKPPEPEVMPPT